MVWIVAEVASHASRGIWLGDRQEERIEESTTGSRGLRLRWERDRGIRTDEDLIDVVERLVNVLTTESIR